MEDGSTRWWLRGRGHGRWQVRRRFFSRWWFHKYFVFLLLTLGKIPILTHIFQRGWNHQLVLILRRVETTNQSALLSSVRFPIILGPKKNGRKTQVCWQVQEATCEAKCRKWVFQILHGHPELLNWATKKTLVAFHYTGWLIGILIMVYHNPYIPG